jgi:tetratricopeptide (TPR) repeat protein
VSIAYFFFLGVQTSQTQTPDSIKSDLEAISPKIPPLLDSWGVNLPQQALSPLQSHELALNLYQKMQSQFTIIPLDLEPRQLDITSVLSRKYGNPYQMAVLFMASLEICHTPTALVPDKETPVVLFLASEDIQPTVTWKRQRWGIIAIRQKFSSFAEAQHHGKQRYAALQAEGQLKVIDVHPLWKPKKESAIDQLIKRGIEKGQQGKLQAARELFNRALNLDTTNSCVYNNLGNLDLFSKKLASAMLNYLTALQYDDTDAKIHLNLGIAYILQAQAIRGGDHDQITKKDWINKSECAFDAAYRGIGNYEDMCYFLGIPTKDKTKYEDYRQLLLNAERRVTNKDRYILAGPGVSTTNIPVYWKDTQGSTQHE